MSNGFRGSIKRGYKVVSYAGKRVDNESFARPGWHGSIPVSGRTENIIPPQETYQALRGRQGESHSRLLESLPHAAPASPSRSTSSDKAGAFGYAAGK
jgi:hypothetical protein